MRITKIDGELPQIIFSRKAYLKMEKIIDMVSKECAWHGCVTREGNTYRIEDIEIYPQTVTGATVEADEVKYPLWVIQHTDEQINSMRFQGHSHVNMGVSPSGTDLKFYDDLTKQVKDFYIFIIQNKKGEYNLRLVDKENNLLYEDLEYEIDYEVEGLDEWYAESSKLIVEEKPVTSVWKSSSPLEVKTSKTSTQSTVTTGESTKEFKTRIEREVIDALQELNDIRVWQVNYSSMLDKKTLNKMNTKYNKCLLAYDTLDATLKALGTKTARADVEDDFEDYKDAISDYVTFVEDETNGGLW